MIKIYRNKEIDDFLKRFDSRRLEIVKDVEESVADILANVRDRGDEALFEYALRFDGVDFNKKSLEVSRAELKTAHKEIDENLLNILRQSGENIRRFHQKGAPRSWLTWEEDGVVLGQRVLPLQRVGVYVPGGRAAYPSSLIMGVVPAQVAGVEEIVVVTPCDAEGNVNATILATAYELGVDRVFRIGGAHAVAALAYGTESIPRVEKIVGPGNIYVATAKKLLYGQCGIDMVAGPSEVTIIADDSADPGIIAADLLAQAEHDPLASSILLTNSETLAEKVVVNVAEQVAGLSRQEIIKSSLANYGGIILTHTLEQSIALCNDIAPEHLGLHVRDPWTLMGKIRNAGAIFLGSYAPETVGDYWAGPNHILPTNGSARFFSPLRTDDFVKVSSVISYTKEAIEKNGEKIMVFANAEGLDAHANAIKKRM